ncbi:MAG: hypothetical protein JO248_19775, partial [Acidimicrobiia bacterium]|nr:hypothetical protein [Acidimicrobiia bacterium]
MSRRLSAAAMSMLAIVGIMLIAAAPPSTAAVRGATAEKKVGRRAEHGKASHNDTSAPLREIRAARPVPRREHPDSPMPVPGGPLVADPVVQPSAPGAPSASSATNFAGIGVTGSAPSDANGAVGPNDYVDMVNARIQVFAKDGTTLLGPVPTNTLWSGFGGECETNDDGDGTVRYDALADRWVVSQFALGPSGKGPFAQCVAVSTTSDPTGSYYRYAFAFANFPDYPKLGIWPDAYYQTMNTFGTTGSFLGAETCAYDRNMMLNGQLAGLQCINATTTYGAILPGDLDGTTPPPAGAPDMQIGLGTDNTHLASFAFHVDWTPGNASATLTESDVPVAAYSTACAGGVCVPQLGTSQQLDSLADRVMYRYAYRNFGDHESWVVTYSVDVGGPSAPRWTELRRTPPATTGSPVVYQQSTYAPDSNWRWMGSTAMDAAGDIALGYSESSPTMKPAIAYSGHQRTDALGVMEPETVLVHGAGAQTGGLNRWGDYSSMSVDPSDGCTFWYTNQFLPADGSFNWQTQVGSFSFPACAPRSDPDFSVAATPPAATLAAPGSTSTTVSIGRTAGPAQAVALSASGLPAGASATFSSASVTPGATQPATSTMTVTVPAATVPGTYPVTISATGTSTSHAATFTLTVPGPTITNGGFESGLTGWTTSIGSASVTSSAPHTGTAAALLGAATATNGDSSIRQAFTPTQPSTLSFWYQVTCPDSVTYDWATATLYDNTAATQTTVLPKTCTNSHSWVNVTTPVPASMVGHALTLTLTSHDDGYPGDPTFTTYDDVTLVPTTAPDFSL